MPFPTDPSSPGSDHAPTTSRRLSTQPVQPLEQRTWAHARAPRSPGPEGGRRGWPPPLRRGQGRPMPAFPGAGPCGGGPGRLDRSRSRRGNRHGLRRERRAITLSGAASCGRRCLRQRARGRLELDGHSRLRVSAVPGVEWVIGRGSGSKVGSPAAPQGLAAGACSAAPVIEGSATDSSSCSAAGTPVGASAVGSSVDASVVSTSVASRPTARPTESVQGPPRPREQPPLGDGPDLGLRNRFGGGLRDGGGVGFGGRRVLGNRLVLRSSGVLGSRGVLGDVRPARCCSIVGAPASPTAAKAALAPAGDHDQVDGAASETSPATEGESAAAPAMAGTGASASAPATPTTSVACAPVADASAVTPVSRSTALQVRCRSLTAVRRLCLVSPSSTIQVLITTCSPPGRGWRSPGPVAAPRARPGRLQGRRSPPGGSPDPVDHAAQDQSVPSGREGRGHLCISARQPRVNSAPWSRLLYAPDVAVGATPIEDALFVVSGHGPGTSCGAARSALGARGRWKFSQERAFGGAFCQVTQSRDESPGGSDPSQRPDKRRGPRCAAGWRAAGAGGSSPRGPPGRLIHEGTANPPRWCRSSTTTFSTAPQGRPHGSGSAGR